MSEINPDFSFPAFTSTSQPQPLGQLDVPTLGSPVSKGRRHQHRRSAAISEDLSTVDLSAIVPSPRPGSASFGPPRSPLPPLRLSPPPAPPKSPTRDEFQFQFHSQLNPSSPLRPVGEPGQILPSMAFDEPESPRSKKKKRRSFVSLFRKSGEYDRESEGIDTLDPPDSIGEKFTSSQLGSPVRVQTSATTTPPQSVGTEKPIELLLPSVTPVMQQTSQFSGSPLSPRALESPRPVLGPTIDLDEALSCSFSHSRGKSDSVLDSPFSKGVSGMNALEEADEEEDDESDKQFHCFRQPSQSRMSSPRGSILRTQGVVTAEQVSNLAILDTRYSPPPPPPALPNLPPHPSSTPPVSVHRSSTDSGVRRKHMSTPPQIPPKRGHNRRRSLIDKLLRRYPS